jgi:hypothetical protein
MTTEAQTILDEALKLPDAVRAEIAQRLLDSVRHELSDDEYVAEIRRRVLASERGEAELIPAADVIREARERLGE